MRTAVIAALAFSASVMPVAAQSAVRQAIKSVAETMAAAPRCAVVFDRDVAEKALAGAGYDPADKEHVADMEFFSSTSRATWGMMSGERLQTECELLWQSFGPDGLVRKGLLRK